MSLHHLREIKKNTGKYDDFEIVDVLNHLKYLPDTNLWSSNKTGFNLETGYCNENDDCKDFVVKYIHEMQIFGKQYITIDVSQSIFGALSDNVSARVESDGYYVLGRLSQNVVDNILNAFRGKSIRFYGRRCGRLKCGEYITIDQIPERISVINHPIHTYFYCTEQDMQNIQDLVNIPEIARLLVDPLILKMAQQHIGCLPKLQCINAWISFYTEKEHELSFAAQKWHQDNDCHKFFKVFLYLNDVDHTNGAHEIIKSSKRNIAHLKKTYVLKQGQVIMEENKQIVSGEAGTVFVEDTRNLHQGGKVTDPYKHRILLHWWYGSNNDTCYNKQYFEPSKLSHRIFDPFLGIIV